jgi:hypothetical protein
MKTPPSQIYLDFFVRSIYLCAMYVCMNEWIDGLLCMYYLFIVGRVAQSI